MNNKIRLESLGGKAMKLSKMDPQFFRNHILLIQCKETLDYVLPDHPEEADGVMAYCFLDPLRGYRLLLCTVIRVKPLIVYRNYYISMDVPYGYLRNGQAVIYEKDLQELSTPLQKMIYEVKRSTINNLLLLLSRMELDDWKITHN